MSNHSNSAKEKKLAELRSSLQRHDELYYRQAQPEISDQEYDRLKSEYEQLQSDLDPLGLFTGETGQDAVSNPQVSFEVGDDRLDSFKSHNHAEVMLSLDNTYDQSEFFEFDKRLQKILGQENLSYVVEPKIDGVAVSLSYHKGRLQQAVTRGNGIQGDIITQNILHLTELPREICSADVPDFMEIRGEIYMEHDEFLRINQAREDLGEPLYANPRNLAAGTVKLLDPKEARQRKLKIVLYGLGACQPQEYFKTQTSLCEALLSRVLDCLEENGKLQNLIVERVPGSNEIPSAVDLILDSSSLDSIIGLGVVIKGSTSHHQLVAELSGHALQNLSLQHHTPVINGIVVTDNVQAAEERITGPLDRGSEFARAAIDMAALKKKWTRI